MFAILGATGNVGTSTCQVLRKAGAPVRAIVRDTAKAKTLRDIGCEIVSADIQDGPALAAAMAGADAVQIIVPFSPQAADPAEHLRASGRNIMAALRQTRPSRVLLVSDYGAHLERNIGLPSLFHELEARFRELCGHRTILRSAEHMHNWGRAIPAALESGILPTFQDPTDMVQPSIAAADLGRIAADLWLGGGSGEHVTVIHAEGPRRYSARDVAAALGRLTGKNIEARAIARHQWESVLGNATPPSLAELLIRTNDARNSGGLVDVEPQSGAVIYGQTALIDALRALVPTP